MRLLLYNIVMIAQKYRFHGHGSIRYVLKNGRGYRGHSMSIKFVHNPHRQYSRVGIIVSKKVLHDAVPRNRVRRRLYELVHTILLPHLATLGEPLDIVITVHDGGIKDEAPERLQHDFEKLIKEIS